MHYTDSFQQYLSPLSYKPLSIVRFHLDLGQLVGVSYTLVVDHMLGSRHLGTTHIVYIIKIIGQGPPGPSNVI